MSETKLPEDFWTVEIPIDPLAQDPEAGADLTKLEAHEAELESIVLKMWEDMTTETKLLDGVEVPEQETIVLPRISEEEFRAWLKNEPSQSDETKE